MGIFLISLLLLFLLWPTITRWMRRYMANKAEDYLRSATGMPPRPGSRRARKEEKTRRNSGDGTSGDFSGARYDDGSYYSRSRYGRRGGRASSSPIIPREYAEDVEYVETKEFSQTAIDPEPRNDYEGREWHESQVSDAEWEEIKTRKRK